MDNNDFTLDDLSLLMGLLNATNSEYLKISNSIIMDSIKLNFLVRSFELVNNTNPFKAIVGKLKVLGYKVFNHAEYTEFIDKVKKKNYYKSNLDNIKNRLYIENYEKIIDLLEDKIIKSSSKERLNWVMLRNMTVDNRRKYLENI